MESILDISKQPQEDIFLRKTTLWSDPVLNF